MSLSPGAQLGPYKILSPIGAGGMGEVYKAIDTRLDRIVAIKVLTAALSTDAEFRERFDREARTISQLEHPHICALYDVGEQGGAAFLVMQYLEGETLADRLKKGALSFGQTLQYAIQIADALDRAHGAGIVHRDLKPGNIMLTKAGAILLDFGLAKANRPALGGTVLSMVPTTPANLTEQGTILGTFQYMAPEQLEALAADARTDVFAYGAVVYEMVTGNKAFEGRSQATLIASILTADPPYLTKVQPLTPPVLDHVVRVALAKDPDARWQSMRDIALELRWITDGESDPRVPAHAVLRYGGKGVAAAVLLGVLLGAAVTRLATWKSLRSGSTATLSITRFSIPLVSGTRLPTDQAGIALSPDGRTVVVAAADGTGRRLYVRQMDGVAMTPLSGTDGASEPFFSPDGQWVGFTAGGKLRKVALGGGAPQDICDAAEGWPAAWGDDGFIFFTATSGSGLYRVAAAGGTPQIVTTPRCDKREKTHNTPSILPGGKVVLFTVGTADISSFDDADVEALTLATGQRKTLVRGAMNARYVASGHLIYGRAGLLLAVPFDLEHLEVTGPPTMVASDVVTDPHFGLAAFAVSRDGSLLYAPGGVRTRNAQLMWVDRVGRSEPFSDLRRPFMALHFSPEGQRIALEIDAASTDVWIHDVAGATTTRLTAGWDNLNPIWSPDGTRVTFQSDRGTPGAYDLYSQLADGAGSAERLPIDTTPFSQYPESWSPNGQYLLFARRDPAIRLWIWSPGEGKARPFLEGAFKARISPDGRWMAYQSSAPGRSEVFVQAFPGPSRKWSVSSDGGSDPVWRRDGRELFYRSGEWMMASRIDTTPEFSIGRPQRLFKLFKDWSPGRFSPYDVAPDGRFLMIRNEPQDISQVNVVLNWFEELKNTSLK